MFEQTFKNIDDILWKETGCTTTTELDNTEQTSWMLFLKYLDDLEQERAMEAELVGKPYDFLIDEPHRWASWTAPKKDDGSFDHDNAVTGDDLIVYLEVFRERASGPDTVEYKIGAVFSEIKNRFSSGYSLHDALELMDALRFRSQEEKSLAYIIGIMNMILHGIEVPNIVHTNRLTENLADIQEKDQFDVILANPPFGGKERKEVQQNFPVKTGETAFLFLKHFIKSLKTGGRAAVVIKNTFLSNPRSSARNCWRAATCTPCSTAPAARSSGRV